MRRRVSWSQRFSRKRIESQTESIAHAISVKLLDIRRGLAGERRGGIEKGLSVGVEPSSFKRRMKPVR